MHVFAAQPERLTDPDPRGPQQQHQEPVAGVAGDIDQPRDLLDRQPLDSRIDRRELDQPGTDRPTLVILTGVQARKTP
ncbi:hypothetical protein BG844_04635 [Couchioplanes caeruleus subsp. caeruleus]|uniref:Uncharacterized protein n=2 Tax=Couchioplanes caeruleus TaxID=56438 RepID=A0A1K0FRS0_9ACTN|nr:hypothetical protein BG844_04635 [Couchioplanes caeruleus subsp. caeruleus]